MESEVGRVFTTPEGFTLSVSSSMYMDWGLTITWREQELFYSPCFLSNESYGTKPDPERFEDWDEAEEAALNGDEGAFVPWTDADWRESLEDEAEALIEAALGCGIWTKAECSVAVRDWVKAQARWLANSPNILDVAACGADRAVERAPALESVSRVVEGLALVAATLDPLAIGEDFEDACHVWRDTLEDIIFQRDETNELHEEE